MTGSASAILQPPRSGARTLLTPSLFARLASGSRWGVGAQPHALRARHVEILCVVTRGCEIGGIGPNFAADTSSSCNESALVIWCCPIMEMEQ